LKQPDALHCASPGSTGCLKKATQTPNAGHPILPRLKNNFLPASEALRVYFLVVVVVLVVVRIDVSQIKAF
jgi:hypothetical protein